MNQLIVLGSFLDKFSLDQLKSNFITEDRYMYLVRGLGISLEITLFAAILGIVIGTIMALMKMSRNGFFRAIANVYITILRGTPVVTQLLIIYFVIFASVDISKIVVAVIAFGLNSGAYVAEIIRAGILSIDKGQTEAGRSLGFSHAQTMRYIILPQAVKNILPALGNEFIVLLKETSVAGYIAIEDLTKGADIIRSITYNAFLPLITVAIIYLILTSIFSYLLGILERRLRQGDSR